MRKFVAGASLTAFLGLLVVAAEFSQSSPQTPMQAMWAGIKKKLTGPGGQRYFRDTLDGSELPTLEGSLISAMPPDHPSVLVVGISNPGLPEVTLVLKNEQGKEGRLNGPLMTGSQIRFHGIVKAFTQDPFMLTFEVSTDKNLTALKR